MHSPIYTAAVQAMFIVYVMCHYSGLPTSCEQFHKSLPVLFYFTISSLDGLLKIEQMFLSGLKHMCVWK